MTSDRRAMKRGQFQVISSWGPQKLDRSSSSEMAVDLLEGLARHGRFFQRWRARTPSKALVSIDGGSVTADQISPLLEQNRDDANGHVIGRLGYHMSMWGAVEPEVGLSLTLGVTQRVGKSSSNILVLDLPSPTADGDSFYAFENVQALVTTIATVLQPDDVTLTWSVESPEDADPEWDIWKPLTGRQNHEDLDYTKPRVGWINYVADDPNRSPIPPRMVSRRLEHGVIYHTALNMAAATVEQVSGIAERLEAAGCLNPSTVLA